MMDCGVALSPSKSVRKLAGATSLTGGQGFTCAIVVGGTVKCWGENTWGELGKDTGYAQRQGVVRQAIPIVGIRGVVAISASVTNKSWCALLRSGGIKCIGFNIAGQLGNGSDTPDASHVPLAVRGLPGPAVDVAVGGATTCAALNDGTVWCWGSASYSEIGPAVPITSPGSEIYKPTQIEGLPPDIVDVTAGSAHMCALTAQGAVYCWGQNTYGQLGNGTRRNSYKPHVVIGLASGVKHIWAGMVASCALMTSGQVRCWGQGPNGDGTARASTRPVIVRGLPAHITDVSMGAGHSCARTTGGAIYCWGGSDAPLGNPVGDGDAKQRLLPVRVF
jgi:alpha-tubulin suppressor-like RCC1 family protein